jgi:uncharacterized RDD family membrane protein YckC
MDGIHSTIPDRGDPMVCRNHPDVAENVRHCVRCANTFCPDCLVDINGLPHCADCKAEQLLDIRSGVDRTTLTYAGVGKRFGAVFLDGLIVTLPPYLLFMGVLLGTARKGGEPNLWFVTPMYVLIFLAMPVYEAIMFKRTGGQTIGKKAMNVRVVRVDGSPLTTGQCWGRAFGKLLMGCIGILDYVPAILTKEKTTIHDLIASTRVIETY